MSHATGLTITNPFVLYRTLLATKRLRPDPAQHRLALHLLKLYDRLKDYSPEIDFRHRLGQIDKLINARSTPSLIDRIGQFDSGGKKRSSLFGAFRDGEPRESQSKALIKTLTDHESAIHIDSPQGLLVYGEVGTGKSLLIDLLADSLPSPNKRRWHFNTFMLEIFAKLERLRKNRLRLSSMPHDGVHDEHSMLWLARDLISTSPILFLDEFQLPDRATSKILSHLFTSFFQLGGVLIATSNRMPEELAKASGSEFSAPPSSRLGFLGRPWRSWGAKSSVRTSRHVSGAKNDSALFLDLLKSRCEVWHVEGHKDWRMEESVRMLPEQHDVTAVDNVADKSQDLGPLIFGTTDEQGLQERIRNAADMEGPASPAKTLPKHYFVRLARTTGNDRDIDSGQAWQSQEVAIVLDSQADRPSPSTQISWEQTDLCVYGRKVAVPRHFKGVSKWTFDELCSSNLGPADYTTLASTFHTFIVTGVPVLTASHSNEARRLITLLDSLYESRCKLLFSAEVGPDELFFPANRPNRPIAFPARANMAQVPDEVPRSTEVAHTPQSADSVYSETISEVYQDSIAPFRPNTSLYSSSASMPAYADSDMPTSASQLSVRRSILADEDSDFGPTYGAGRRHGVSDGSPGAGNEIGRQLDFADTGAFTGEDEKFAYKRARSRLWEMCGARWWERQGDWWRPLAREARIWEGAHENIRTGLSSVEQTCATQASGDEHLFRHGASPFRTSEAAPPRFSWVHAWGMQTWGKKAGDWGTGRPRESHRRETESKTDRNESVE